MTARLSIVIPAHDEGAVIDRILGVLCASERRDEFEIVVAANGCTDDTAARARAYDGVQVVETPEASKIGALQAGDDAASVFPRAYVDADVRIGPDALLALADALDAPGIEVASPRLHVDTSGASWLVRQHYRIWELSDYRRSDHIGSGVYALTRAGRARFDAWPDVVADDRFVQQLFAPAERAMLVDHSFSVRSAADMRAHLRRSVRIARGNRELPDRMQHEDAARPSAASRGGLARRVAARPGLWVSFAVYCVSWTLPNVLARRDIARARTRTWNRDDTSRVMA
ncbi:glycosyltransferase [Microbacterium sp. QXD-8]|uniref:4,4'-diaponeurosporenoate glycosyltransferase n=1 Tax=Microbacterium psychrotolerans TaxID=3068321 RepID=A0ABU0Z199_9MICO|nr:glycosyltransferase [Microbacterium sp. QXD-8]MDQ7878344.1 glycosyltransferase [Microbacterium sp. QXD-8]